MGEPGVIKPNKVGKLNVNAGNSSPSGEQLVNLRLIAYQEKMAVATNRQLTTNKLSG